MTKRIASGSSLLHAIALLRAMTAEREPDRVERAALTAFAHELLKGTVPIRPLPKVGMEAETRPAVAAWTPAAAQPAVTTTPPIVQPAAPVQQPEPPAQPSELDALAQQLQSALTAPLDPVPAPPRAVPDLGEVAREAKAAMEVSMGEVRELLGGIHHAAGCLAARNRPHRKLLQAAATVCSRLHVISPSQDSSYRLHVWLRGYTSEALEYLHHMQADNPASRDEAQAALQILGGITRRPRARRGRPERVSVRRRQPMSADVLRLAGLMKGRHILLLGNDGLRDHLIRRAKAHGLRLRWVNHDGKQSIYARQGDIRAGDVGLVAVLIRWSPHATAEARMLCESARKPFVNITAGYGLNTLARNILEQAGDQLQAG